MNRRREPDESALFREAMRDVKPLGRTGEAADRPRPRARTIRAGRAVAPPERPGLPGVSGPSGLSGHPGPPGLAGLPGHPTPAPADAPSHARPGAERWLRRLRRGDLPVQASLDLHGLTAARAQRILAGFLTEAHARGTRCVRIVHGKGLRSGSTGPVLRPLVTAMLRSSPLVLAFTPAPPAQGGSGATHVLLRAAG